MSHDELIEELAREHRYRHILVAAAVIGVLASAVVGVAFTLGSVDKRGADRSSLGLFVLPFATSMVIGSGIHRYLIARGRRGKR